MPTDSIDVSVAAASILSMLLVRSDAFGSFDGLDARQHVSTLGSANVVVSALACAMTYQLALAVKITRAELLPLIAMALCFVIVHVAIAVTRGIAAPLHALLSQLRVWLMPATLLTSAASMLIAPPPSLLHALLNTSLCALLFGVVLHFCLMLHTQLAALPGLQAVPKNSLHYHALSLLMAALIAGLGSAVLGNW